MQLFPDTIVLRHRRENLKKCSLRGLEGRPDIHFYTYPKEPLPPLADYIVLALNAPLLTCEDSSRGLLLIDATWRYAETMTHYVKQTQAELHWRSLPKTLKTAYPRRQEDCEDPERGLASVEALYAAYVLLGRDSSGLLDNYYWKDQFLELNPLDLYPYKN